MKDLKGAEKMSKEMTSLETGAVSFCLNCGKAEPIMIFGDYDSSFVQWCPYCGLTRVRDCTDKMRKKYSTTAASVTNFYLPQVTKESVKSLPLPKPQKLSMREKVWAKKVITKRCKLTAEQRKELEKWAKTPVVDLKAVHSGAELRSMMQDGFDDGWSLEQIAYRVEHGTYPPGEKPALATGKKKLTNATTKRARKV